MTLAPTTTTTTTTTTTVPEADAGDAPLETEVMSDLKSDEIVVMLNGKRSFTNPTVNGNRVSLAIADVRYAIVAVDENGEELRVDDSGRIFLNDTRTFLIDISGLDAGSEHELWMYSEPRLLTTLTGPAVGESVNALVRIPGDADSGWHSVVLAGETSTGDAFAASLRVNVPQDENVVIKIATSAWVWALLVVAVAVALLLPSRSSRRRRA